MWEAVQEGVQGCARGCGGECLGLGEDALLVVLGDELAAHVWRRGGLEGRLLLETVVLDTVERIWHIQDRFCPSLSDQSPSKLVSCSHFGWGALVVLWNQRAAHVGRRGGHEQRKLLQVKSRDITRFCRILPSAKKIMGLGRTLPFQTVVTVPCKLSRNELRKHGA